jgi:hypothetical protein
MKVPSQQQLDDEEIEALFQKMTAKPRANPSKIGLRLMWLIPAACWVMLIVVWWRLFA